MTDPPARPDAQRRIHHRQMQKRSPNPPLSESKSCSIGISITIVVDSVTTIPAMMGLLRASESSQSDHPVCTRSCVHDTSVIDISKTIQINIGIPFCQDWYSRLYHNRLCCLHSQPAQHMPQSYCWHLHIHQHLYRRTTHHPSKTAGSASSTKLSQLLSTPSQISVPMGLLHLRHHSLCCLPQIQRADRMLHTNISRSRIHRNRHRHTKSHRHNGRSSSSIRASQSLSTPSHTSSTPGLISLLVSSQSSALFVLPGGVKQDCVTLDKSP